MEETMDVVRIGRKEQYLNTLEKYYIYKISKEKLHTNDTNIVEHNPIFEELQKKKKNTTRHLPIPLTPSPNTVTEYIQTIPCRAHTHTQQLNAGGIDRHRRSKIAEKQNVSSNCL
jgi:hypothetical protein